MNRPRTGRVVAAAAAVAVLSVALFESFLALGLLNRSFPGFLVYRNGMVSPLRMPGWGGADAGVRYLDRVLSIDGEPLADGSELWSLVGRHAAEGPLRVEVERGGRRLAFSVPAERFGAGDFLGLWGLLLVTGLAFAGIGIVVLRLKPAEPTSWTFAAFTWTLAFYILTGLDYSTTEVLARPFLVFTALLPAACLAMGLTVPEAPPWIARRPRRLLWVVLSALPLLILYQVWMLRPRPYAVLDLVTGGYDLLSGIAVPLLIVRTARHGSRSLSRRRARAILRGVLLSFGLSTLLVGGIFVSGGRIPISAVALASLGVPASFAWAILRRDFLGLGEVLRLSLAYLIVTVTAVGGYVALLALIPLGARRWSPAGHVWIEAVLAVAVGLALNPLYRWTRTTLDRAFFRAQYDFETAVEGLLKRITGSLDITQTAEALVTLLHQEMHVSHAAMLIRDRLEGRYWPIAVRGRPEEDPSLTPSDSARPFEWLERTLSVVTLETLEEARDRAAAEELTASGFSVLLPIAFEGELYGVVAMGPKRSGAAYTRKDLKLLGALVAQTGAVLRNSLLYGEVLVLKQGLEQRVRERTQELEDALGRLRRTQAQLVQAGKMAGLGQLVAGVAHELNNPVSVIASGVGRLRERLPAPDRELGEVLEVVQDGARRAREIVAQLRTFSRHDEAELQSVQLSEGLDSALRLLQHRWATQVDVERRYEEAPPVLCRAGEVNQIFLNLLTNALDAVEARLRRDGDGYRGRLDLEVRPAPEGGAVEASVADNGGGVPEALRSRVFDPFFTTKPVGQGTGLGLSISYDIAARHGGTLALDSTEGEGARFTLKLPLSPPAATEPGA